MMTQLESARRGIITDEMAAAARGEGCSPESIRDGVADGTIVVCHNRLHGSGRSLGVGKGLRTKVNANIGSSADDTDIAKELEKARVAVAHGADALMDLSTGGPVDEYPQGGYCRDRRLHRQCPPLPGRPGHGAAEKEGHRGHDRGRHLCRHRQAR